MRILGYIEKERFFPAIGGASCSRFLGLDNPISTKLKNTKGECGTSRNSVGAVGVATAETL